MKVQSLVGALGAQVIGPDLSTSLSAAEIDDIRCALYTHQVLVFREQKLTVDQHKAFARRFGPLHVHPFVNAKALDSDPTVLRVVKEKDDTRVFGEIWHSDVTFLKEPVLGSILYALDTPPVGGDTLFANMYRAYESLSDGMKALLEPLVGIHESEIPEVDPATNRRLEPMRLHTVRCEHPVIRTHPVTGRKTLYVNRTYTKRIKGLTDEESRPLLEYLFAHATRAEFTCRVRWQPGTVTFWDNQSTQHLPVNDYQGFRREMHRITVNCSASE